MKKDEEGNLHQDRVNRKFEGRERRERKERERETKI